MSDIQKYDNVTFDSIKHIGEDGHEYWEARELQQILQYAEWRNFKKVIETAKIACKISQNKVDYHFVEVNKTIAMPKGAQKTVPDCKLSRYACYLIVMNGDPRKKVISLGQTYFAVKTREQELSELYSRLNEDEKRLFLRSDVKQKNMLLFEVARRCGIKTTYDYAQFNDAGYMGLYGGMRAYEIANKKGLSPDEEILDYMGSEELGANLFRITQTEAKLKRENILTKEAANATHYEIGKTVRETIKMIGGTMPEELSVPDKGIKQLEKEKREEIMTKTPSGIDK